MLCSPFFIATLVHSQSQSFPFILNVTSLFGNGTLGELHLYYRVSALINGNIGDVCYNGVTDQVADMLCKEELDIEGNCMCSCMIVTLKQEHQLC